MSKNKNNFVCAGIAVITFILCYRFNVLPSGASLQLKLLWLMGPFLTAALLSFGISAVTGLIARSSRLIIPVGCASLLICSLIFAALNLFMADSLKNFILHFYKTEKKAIAVAKADKAIKKAVKEIRKEDRDMPEPQMYQPLKVVLDSREKQPGNKQSRSKLLPVIKQKTEIAFPEGCGSPFDYGASELNQYETIKDQKLLTEISIKGIISVKGREPVAILELQKNKKAFFVRKGNVVRLQERARDNNVTEIYLQIKNIKEHEVEIVQQQRPDKVIIVR
ncbi:hypothetical protein P0136_09200 [Lentisphaerota bacterium ZTH]|nr:hypothetical protein JYG24_13290 [Lentisphaerota bacterium]WET05539.1 hypothetical protein P0136_09200 [Lentisphaerota bacterium ZTH]